jgi:hypothetical protein
MGEENGEDSERRRKKKKKRKKKHRKTKDNTELEPRHTEESLYSSSSLGQPESDQPTMAEPTLRSILQEPDHPDHNVHVHWPDQGEQPQIIS